MKSWTEFVIDQIKYNPKKRNTPRIWLNWNYDKNIEWEKVNPRWKHQNCFNVCTYRQSQRQSHTYVVLYRTMNLDCTHNNILWVEAGSSDCMNYIIWVSLLMHPCRAVRSIWIYCFVFFLYKRIYWITYSKCHKMLSNCRSTHLVAAVTAATKRVLLLCVVKVYGVWYTHTRDIYGPHLVKVENISAWLAIHAF